MLNANHNIFLYKNILNFDRLYLGYKIITLLKYALSQDKLMYITIL